ncbi:predicted protein [Postia placenta Mad-698-R]|uniref:Uncharacterized protein n=1 Tax=Postia placenta MAD-698-R-SB12 TaxID=670580 RepID=A0A1X6MRV3_9APHY|nr:hypothetical protein POSPLADRAFT_1151772 [Postia placenta MAD-698-R-SB12]EED79108.1 predicted protein [Postia placenta Mad-698-R]OSX59114.1 hypothetical protein POSPLADRAFT_1151772 [Postia placenta MAD-698-R-SB12]
MESLPQVEARISSELQRAAYVWSPPSPFRDLQLPFYEDAAIDVRRDWPGPTRPSAEGWSKTRVRERSSLPQGSREHQTGGLESDNKRARDNRGRLKVEWLEVFWEPARAASALPLRVAQRDNKAADTKQLRDGGRSARAGDDAGDATQNRVKVRGRHLRAPEAATQSTVGVVVQQTPTLAETETRRAERPETARGSSAAAMRLFPRDVRGSGAELWGNAGPAGRGSSVSTSVIRDGRLRADEGLGRSRHGVTWTAGRIGRDGERCEMRARLSSGFCLFLQSPRPDAPLSLPDSLDAPTSTPTRGLPRPAPPTQCTRLAPPAMRPRSSFAAMANRNGSSSSLSSSSEPALENGEPAQLHKARLARGEAACPAAGASPSGDATKGWAARNGSPSKQEARRPYKSVLGFRARRGGGSPGSIRAVLERTGPQGTHGVGQCEGVTGILVALRWEIRARRGADLPVPACFAGRSTASRCGGASGAILPGPGGSFNGPLAACRAARTPERHILAGDVGDMGIRRGRVPAARHGAEDARTWGAHGSRPQQGGRRTIGSRAVDVLPFGQRTPMSYPVLW